MFLIGENNFQIKIFIKKYKNKIIYFIIKIIILILIIKNILFYNNISNEIKRLEIFLEGKKFIKNCLKGMLINNKNLFIKSSIKIISVIIPIYNSENSIKASIRSIQNQNISQFEIILVNDFSKDNSLKIIKKLKKEDSRIIIINNNKNMGALYSRNIGILSSKGTYIFSLDDDDMFFDLDIFDSIYKIAKGDNFDIVGFKSISINKNYNYNIRKMKDNIFFHQKNNFVLYQPKLGIYTISKKGKYKQNDNNIWSKCIKTIIYKKAVNSLGILKYSNFMSWAEDTSIVFIIYNIASSFKFIHKYGIIHIRYNLASSYTQPKNNKFFGELFLLNVIFDFSNYKSKYLAALYVLKIKKLYKIKKFKFEKNYFFLKFILKKILKCKYLKEINKKKILQKFKGFIF